MTPPLPSIPRTHSDSCRDSRPPLKFSYVIAFEVDRAGVVLVGECPDAEQHQHQQQAQQQRKNDPHLKRGSFAHVSAGEEHAEGLNSTIPAALSAKILRRQQSTASTSTFMSADDSMGASSVDPLTYAADTEAHNLQQRRRVVTLIRLSVPRVGVRARSASAVTLLRVADSGRERAGKDVSADIDGPEGKPDDDNFSRRKNWVTDKEGPSLYVSAKSLEGYLEMEDPGTDVIPLLAVAPPPAPPLPTALLPARGSPIDSRLSASVEADKLDEEKGEGGHASALRGIAAAAATAPGDRSGDERDKRYPPLQSPWPTRAEASDTTVEGSDSDSDAADRSRRSSQAEPLHLRWLAIRKLSLKMGAYPTNAHGGDAGAPAARRRMGEAGESDAGSKKTADADDFPGKEKGIAREEALSVEGLWAEWSPALSFSLGKTGGTVRVGAFTPPVCGHIVRPLFSAES